MGERIVIFKRGDVLRQVCNEQLHDGRTSVDYAYKKALGRDIERLVKALEEHPDPFTFHEARRVVGKQLSKCETDHARQLDPLLVVEKLTERETFASP